MTSSQNTTGGWWQYFGWKSETKPAPPEPAELPTTSQVAEFQPIPAEIPELSGWQRIRGIYEHPNSMEIDVATRVIRMSFLGGFLVGGATGYAQARHAYETNNAGRKYLSPSDAVKRKIDYAIVRFAKGGFATGFKCALISGSIVYLATHLAAYRDKFSAWYFPAISGATACLLHTVGGVFTFPLGVVGAVKAVGLGVSSGLTLSAVVHLYAMAIDKPVAEAYRLFKRDYEKELKSAAEWDSRVKELMEAEHIKWRQTAVKRLKELDQQKLAQNDDF